MSSAELETERLLLRPPRAEDFEAWDRIQSDPEVLRFLHSGGTPSTRESFRHFAFHVGHWAVRGHGHFVLIEKAGGALVGRSGFLDYPGWPGFELGWTLGREHWGRGLASEAARALLAHAFGPMDRARVISLIHPDNARSQAVARRIGERRDGSTRVGEKDYDVWAIERPG